MNCKIGKLIGIPFPYTDLTTNKKRPVLVITTPDKRGDFICVAVTSVLTDEFAITINNASVLDGYLPKQSWIRCDKVFTLNESIAIKEYGTLADEVLVRVRHELCSYLACP